MGDLRVANVFCRVMPFCEHTTKPWNIGVMFAGLICLECGAALNVNWHFDIIEDHHEEVEKIPVKHIKEFTPYDKEFAKRIGLKID